MTLKRGPGGPPRGGSRVPRIKIIIGSIISSLEPLRAAVRAAAQTFGHEPVIAEDFGAKSTYPQVAVGMQARVQISGQRWWFQMKTQPSPTAEIVPATTPGVVYAANERSGDSY